MVSYALAKYSFRFITSYPLCLAYVNASCVNKTFSVMYLKGKDDLDPCYWSPFGIECNLLCIAFAKNLYVWSKRFTFCHCIHYNFQLMLSDVLPSASFWASVTLSWIPWKDSAIASLVWVVEFGWAESVLYDSIQTLPTPSLSITITPLLSLSSLSKVDY